MTDRRRAAPAEAPRRETGRESPKVSRRDFVALTAAAGGALAAPALAQARARIVIVGGGAGGVTAAKYLAASPSVDVTLITASDRYTTCFFSNMYLAGLWSLRSLTYRYDSLAARGVRLLRDEAQSVDRERRTVGLRASGALSYDRLILAPGIAMRNDAIRGYDAEARIAMPHSYQAGFQTYLLRQRMREMRQGGVFVIAAPQGPYRAGTAPYERASLIAHYLKGANPTAKVLIIDAKDGFGLQERFQAQWAASYGAMIEWIPASSTGGGIASVDAGAMSISTGDGATLAADAACIIPPQRAGEIVFAAGLAAPDGWAPVSAEDMRSLEDPNIYVIGDSAKATPMPKSAYSANSQAHRCAFALRAELDGIRLLPARYRAVAWAYIEPLKALRVGATYESSGGAFEKSSGFATPADEPPETLRSSALEGISWYAGVTADMFS